MTAALASPLPLPLISLLLAAAAWLGCTLLARRLPPDSLAGELLRRARLSLALPLLVGGLLVWLVLRLPLGDQPLASPAELRRLLGVVAVVWTMARCKGALLGWVGRSAAMEALENRERLALLDLLDKLVGLLIGGLLGWQLLRLLGVSAGVLLTAGGFSAAALAFGARTLVENGLSGLGLHLSRPFVVGDAIRLPAQQLQGEVEAIGWFTTRLRDPERQTLLVPNGAFASQAVQNLSQVDHRRVQFEITLRPQDRAAVEAITAELRRCLASDAAVDASLPCRAHLLSYGEAGLRLGVLCHAAAADLAGALALQQRLLLETGAVVERHGAAIAVAPRSELGSSQPG